MFQATRRRLAIWYTAVTAILLLLFASGFYFYVRNTLIERIDDTLNHVVEVVERSLVIEPMTTPPAVLAGQFQVNVEASFRNNLNTVEDDHIDIEWFSQTGELLWSTFSQPLDILLHPNRSGETVHISEQNNVSEMILRQVTDRVEIGRQVLGYLRVSHPWFEVTKPIQQLIFDLTLGTILMLIGVATIGWFLSGLAMEPVRDSYQRLKQFTADASHELRSPIAMIQTNVQVALAEPNLSIYEQQQLQVIERITRRLGRLVDDLLFLARQDSGIVKPQFVSLPLDGLLMEVVEEQNAIATQQGIKLSLDFIEDFEDIIINSDSNYSQENEPFTLDGDWDQLVRLFTNLVGNAVQYTPSVGEIKIELKPLPKLKRQATLGKVTESWEKSHSLLKFDGLQVIIKDTGIGIPAEALPNIFDRFYRVDPSRTHRNSGGSGLGLAIAQAIVENHHGQIYLESQINQGTTATVILPLHSSGL
ncbi:MAG TPA: two-component sensor histidine kinase [Planktothrix sp. UBA8407]|jgi:Signal transduction histidine kinase|nr:two-component sensor histidine kinase [Planktothrix sp. UBA8402]HAO10777.1 two-component sensor histidine kinase [Planktothrix sp. UBA8407]HBK21993.1 two-component sensor histidine kinase [Planktothrix sp. UBA10369]